MKNLFVVVAIALTLISVSAFADTSVKGYYKKNGTYVAPHYRSSPDKSYNNNWSTSPNRNPYTGKQGTRQPTWNNQPPKKKNPYKW